MIMNENIVKRNEKLEQKVIKGLNSRNMSGYYASSAEEAVTARINAQMSLADKEKFADVVIDNSGNIENTKAQVTAQLQKVLGAV